MTHQDNIQIVRHIFEAWNKHDPDRYVKLLDEKHVVESDTLPAPLIGREAGRQFMQMYVSAFPDLRFDIDQIFGEGDSHQPNAAAWPMIVEPNTQAWVSVGPWLTGDQIGFKPFAVPAS